MNLTLTAQDDDESWRDDSGQVVLDILNSDLHFYKKVDSILEYFDTHLRAELEGLREKSRSFNGYLKTDGLSIEAVPLAALDEVIAKYGSEGT